MFLNLADYCKIALDSYQGTYNNRYFDLLWTGEVDNFQFSIIHDKLFVYVAVTGSNQFTDWIYNFYSLKKNIGKDIRVHHGFHDGLKKIRPQIDKTLKNHTDKEVVFIGHSLGAAIAQLGALHFSDNYFTSCYTFASPRVGNSEFCTIMNQKVPNNYRVAIKGDIVTNIPKINYYHCGIPILLPSQLGLYKSHSIATYFELLSQQYQPLL